MDTTEHMFPKSSVSTILPCTVYLCTVTHTYKKTRVVHVNAFF